ncbi:beta-lactamase family protein [Streptomyces sp. A7024]|uniref:Beta-lactamase family protein n=1 Tax=Streptomyces coryli TaxID=1128680 RepID=A0A6G4TUG8_9ACTN|nr:serine hydrolase domain-containing protein [Streptomyces coryli]NGN63453.1 beta-lactamase family protein [Streptomyces coryli]
MKIRAAIAAVLTALLLIGCGHAEARIGAKPPRDPVDRRIDAFLRRTLPDGPTGTVMAARGNKLVHCAGFHPRRAGNDCDTVYDVMSITKQFTAAAVLKLEAMGRLKVSDRLSTHLGADGAIVPPDKRGITLHQLLTHTSGLPEGLGDDYEPVSRRQLIQRALRADLRPDRGFHYSNLGYSLLAAVVEHASGLPYERFLATRLFEPAGMRHTGYVLPRWDRDKIAVEYDARGRSQGTPLDHPWADDGPYWNLRGNGGMLSTARDTFAWHRALSRGSGKGGVLPKAQLRKLFTPYVREPGGSGSYGYGWAFADTRVGRAAWHNGGNDWSFASTGRTITGDGITVFWVTNTAYRGGRWNLETLEEDITFGLANYLSRRS